MAAGDVYSAVLPSDLGTMLSSITKGVNKGNIESVRQWRTDYLDPEFTLWVSKGLTPVQALQFLMADGMPKPTQIDPFTLKVNGSSSSLVNTGTDTKAAGSLGFAPTGIPILSGLQASISGSLEQTKTTQQASQADSTIELSVVPVNTASMLTALIGAAQAVNGLTSLPPMLPPPTGTASTAGGSTGAATSTSK